MPRKSLMISVNTASCRGHLRADTFALRLMEKPASCSDSVLLDKSTAGSILADHHLQFTSEVRWAEDLVFNLEYILYANVFVSISKAGYHYVQNPQSICHTQINLASIVQNKLQVFRYYKELYTKLGLYDQVCSRSCINS